MSEVRDSVLEAIAYLGRGKSFRGATTTDLVRHGQQDFVLFGEILDGERHAKVGVRNSHEGLEMRIDGDSAGGVAALAAALPLQIIDPDVHELVAAGATSIGSRSTWNMVFWMPGGAFGGP